jgi:hypothetical protein
LANGKSIQNPGTPNKNYNYYYFQQIPNKKPKKIQIKIRITQTIKNCFFVLIFPDYCLDFPDSFGNPRNPTGKTKLKIGETQIKKSVLFFYLDLDFAVFMFGFRSFYVWISQFLCLDFPD